MNVEILKKGLESIDLNGYILEHYHGIFFFIREYQNYTIKISLGYSDFSPKYIFSSLVTGIHFSVVEKILNPLNRKYFNKEQEYSKYLDSVRYGGGWFPDEFRFDGIITEEDLKYFLVEVQKRINDLVLPWIEDNNTLDKIVLKVNTLPENDRSTIQYFGGQFALYRKLIILHLQNDMVCYEKIKKKRIEGFKNLINVQKKEEFVKYLLMLEELIEILEEH